jgi:hypothetical protein
VCSGIGDLLLVSLGGLLKSITELHVMLLSILLNVSNPTTSLGSLVVLLGTVLLGTVLLGVVLLRAMLLGVVLSHIDYL